MQERHPNYQKEVPVQRGGFGLGARIVKDVIGREREKEEGEVALTLHVSSRTPSFVSSKKLGERERERLEADFSSWFVNDRSTRSPSRSQRKRSTLSLSKRA